MVELRGFGIGDEDVEGGESVGGLLKRDEVVGDGGA